MLTNCKIVGDHVTYAEYSKQPPDVQRGSPGYIMSRSELMDFAECPAKWILEPPSEDDDTKSTIFGRLVETLAMCPEDFDALFAVAPKMYKPAKGSEEKLWDFRSTSCQQWRDERQSEGFTVISLAEKMEALMAVKQLMSDPNVVDLVDCSRKQVHVKGLWHDKDTGLDICVQALLDLVPNKKHDMFGKWLADQKTAREGNPSKFVRAIADNGYDMQAALHNDLYVAATGEDRTDFVFLLSENEPPFHVVKPMPAVTTEFMQFGREKYQGALRYYAQCLKTNKWPSYQVFGIHAGLIQLIGPESLWSYKQYGGQGSLQTKIEYSMPPKVSEDEIPT
jgi:exodeoxyribonuclease VIII